MKSLDFGRSYAVFFFIIIFFLYFIFQYLNRTKIVRIENIRTNILKKILGGVSQLKNIENIRRS